MIRNYTSYKKNRTYRVVIPFINGNYGTGSGFFISEKLFVTCFHVVFGSELRNIKADPAYISAVGNDQKSKLQSYFNSRIQAVEVEISNLPSRQRLTLVDFNEKYDIALLTLNEEVLKINVCELDFDKKFRYGDTLNFFGFPMHHSYAADKVPMAYQEGTLSAFVNTDIGGEKYEHIQMNSINLGGNSGAPVFLKHSRKVVGIINGNMNYGNDYNVTMPPNGASAQLAVAPFRVPLPIAYFTPMQVIKINTNFFDSIKISKVTYTKVKNVIKKILSLG